MNALSSKTFLPPAKPSSTLLSEAHCLGWKYDGIQSGTRTIPDSFQFTRIDPTQSYCPSVNVSVAEDYPIARLRDLIADALRKHAEMQPTL